MGKTELVKELERVSKEFFDKKEFYSSGKINQAIDVIAASTIDEGKKSKENYRTERKGVLSSFSQMFGRKMINQKPLRTK